MLGLQTLRCGIAAAGAATATYGSVVYNESRRSFYEDEKDVFPVPGTVTGHPGPVDGPSSSQKFVNGVLVNSPGSVESVFKSVRETVYGGYTEAQKYVDQGFDQVYSTERQVTSTVSSLHEKSEDLLPNALYIVIAGLSGTIMARQRGIIAKTVFPIVLGVGSFKYFLPKTFASTTDFLWKLEQQKLPAVAEQQKFVVSKSEELVNQIEKTTESSQKSVNSGLDYARHTIKKYTGLNLDDDATKK